MYDNDRPNNWLFRKIDNVCRDFDRMSGSAQGAVIFISVVIGIIAMFAIIIGMFSALE